MTPIIPAIPPLIILGTRENSLFLTVEAAEAASEVVAVGLIIEAVGEEVDAADTLAILLEDEAG